MNAAGFPTCQRPLTIPRRCWWPQLDARSSADRGRWSGTPEVDHL